MVGVGIKIALTFLVLAKRLPRLMLYLTMAVIPATLGALSAIAFLNNEMQVSVLSGCGLSLYLLFLFYSFRKGMDLADAQLKAASTFLSQSWKVFTIPVFVGSFTWALSVFLLASLIAI